MSEDAVGDRLIKIYLNPHQFFAVDEPWASLKAQPVTPEMILEFLCTPGLPCDTDSLVARYREISSEEVRLFAAPNEVRILDKLIWPLRHAKSGYMVGNYLGTISLSGMVAEMVAVLLFDTASFSVNGEPMTIEKQSAVFGSAFEKLGQERRVGILRAYDIISDKTKGDFNTIRTLRRKYLHLWSQDHDLLPVDAVRCFKAAVSLVVRVIGQDVRDGKLILNPAIVKYLEAHGVYQDNDDSESV